MKGESIRSWAFLRAWFALTAQERISVIAFLAIFLIGLTARHLHLKNEQPITYHPEGVAADWGGDRHE